MNKTLLDAVAVMLSQIYSDRYGIKVTVQVK